MNRRNLLKTILSLPALLFVKPELEPEYKIYDQYTCASNGCCGLSRLTRTTRTYTCGTNDCSCCYSTGWSTNSFYIQTED